MELTKEDIQRKIDHYAAIRDAYHTMCQDLKDPDKAMRHYVKMTYYGGKSDAWTDLYNELFPEMEGERAYPFSQDDHDKVVNDTMLVEKYAKMV